MDDSSSSSVNCSTDSSQLDTCTTEYESDVPETDHELIVNQLRQVHVCYVLSGIITPKSHHAKA